MIYPIFSSAELKVIYKQKLCFLAAVFAVAVMSLTGCTRTVTADFMFEMGVQFDEKKDYAKAVEWYEKAAAAGNASAMINLGVDYERAIGVAQDYGKAREWFQKAIVISGNAYALYNLGVLYDQGLWRPPGLHQSA